MYFRHITRIRTTLVALVIIGTFAVQESWLPAQASAVLLLLIPFLALLNVLHEIGFVIYLHRAFDRIRADVVEIEGTNEKNKLPLRNYHVTFSFHSSPYTTQFSEGGIIQALAGKTQCYVLVDREVPHEVFIDSFSLKYMQLIYALLLAAMVYSYGNYNL
jgi:hypothetical protein